MANHLASEPAGPSTRQQFGERLWRLADLVRAREQRRSFRAKAFRAAFWALDDMPGDLSAGRDELTSIHGIGPGVAKLIEEYRTAGVIEELERLSGILPADSARLRRLPRMTPRILEQLKLEWAVDSVAQMEMMIESGEIEEVRGVGPETAAVWGAILSLWPDDALLPGHQAWVLASSIRAHLSRHLDLPVTITGQVRRVTEWVASIRVAVEGRQDEAVASFVTGSVLGSDFEVGGEGELIAHRTPYGLPLTVHVADETNIGTVIFTSTGPLRHVERIGPTGPKRSEEDVYSEAGVGWVPPPARELIGEVPASLVSAAAVRGDLHIHSEASPDGRLGVGEIAHLLVARGYEYAAITDHTWGLRFGGLDPDALRAQGALVEKVDAGHPEIKLLHGAEVNIDKDGSIDIPDETLATLDVVVAGVHSAFGLDRQVQTARVVAAMRNPWVRILAHPTGRRIGMRAPLDLDLEKVIEAAVEHGVALELNGHRDRLDLSSDMAAMAADAGASLVVNSDAHRIDELGNVRNAVATAQRAGLVESVIVNTFGLADFLAWLESGS